MQRDDRNLAMSRPRVAGSMLPKFVGKRVCVVGKVVQRPPGANQVVLLTAENSQVVIKVLRSDDSMFQLNHIYEVVGFVNPDHSIGEEMNTVYSDNFDLVSYNKAIGLAHEPRFAQMFWA